jgi:hypothetical protein
MICLRRLFSRLSLFGLLLCVACSPVAASTLPIPRNSPENAASPAGVIMTPTEACTCAAVLPSPTPVQVVTPPAATTTVLNSFTTSPTPQLIPPFPSLASCTSEECNFSEVFPLARPIGPGGNDKIDVTYRFGSTDGKKRDPHHGVEFLNSTGTPVLAAADGVVVVAGDDRKVFYGPYSYFYGNLVVIRHAIPGLAQPLFTLYGHLSQVSVQVGQEVKTGQQVGLVGMTGIATGSHLHFEVRLGENTYKNSRNPELWLGPHTGPDGQPNGALAGRILDARGNYLPVSSIVVQHLPAPGQPADGEFYLGTYEEKGLLGQSPWEESFAAGDLPAGWYRVSFAQNGMQARLVQVLPGQLTVVTWKLGG